MQNLNNEVGEKVSYSKVAAAMKKGFEQDLEIEFVEDELTKEEKELAEKLFNEKYSRKEWNFKF